MASLLNALPLIELFAVCAVFFVTLTLAMVGMGFWTERHYQKRGRKIFDVPRKKQQLKRELIGNISFIALIVPITALAIDTELLKFREGFAAEIVTFLGCYTAFQIYYYGLHRLMHHRALFWSHKWHHESLVTTPLTGLSMSPVEGVGWALGLLGPAMVLSVFHLLGAWGLMLFFAVHWSGNINGHANAEFLPEAFGKNRWISWFGNPVVYHSLHHARFDGHYGFGAAFMDRLFRSEFPDWQGVHAKVVSGTPLKSLRERGDAD